MRLSSANADRVLQVAKNPWNLNGFRGFYARNSMTGFHGTSRILPEISIVNAGLTEGEQNVRFSWIEGQHVSSLKSGFEAWFRVPSRLRFLNGPV